MALIQGEIQASSGKIANLEEKMDGLQNQNHKQTEILVSIKEELTTLKKQSLASAAAASRKSTGASLMARMSGGMVNKVAKVSGETALQNMFKKSLAEAEPKKEEWINGKWKAKSPELALSLSTVIV